MLFPTLVRRLTSYKYSAGLFFILIGTIPPTEPLRQRRGGAEESNGRTTTSTSSFEGEDKNINTMSNSFDQLKREAVNLERQLEDKIGRYQQVRRTVAVTNDSWAML